uniref:Uncharacterized protein n=1 Tax=Arundo donax TaxID=35708 RepID=A0A0A9BGW2_ARUDO
MTSRCSEILWPSRRYLSCAYLVQLKPQKALICI